MRHSISEGGRALPPPKYCSYSIFSWRMSLSSWARSSSTVLAMGNEIGRSCELPLSKGLTAGSMLGESPRAEETMFPAILCDYYKQPRPAKIRTRPKNAKGARFRAPFPAKPHSPRSGLARNAFTTPGKNQNHLALLSATCVPHVEHVREM